jgi:NAD(P)-dependent dehydrogenase (short-subunit alcohol dehydrogenase family)
MSSHRRGFTGSAVVPRLPAAGHAGPARSPTSPAAVTDTPPLATTPAKHTKGKTMDARHGRYEGRRAVITGGTSGMGAATARRLLTGGARVLVTGATAQSVAGAADLLGPEVIAVRSSAESPEDVAALADLAADRLGGVDLLFLNAGTTGNATFTEVDARDYERIFAVNTRGPFFTAQRFIPLMPAGSSIVLTTSVANAKGLPSSSVYAASKAALRSMARSLARDLLPAGIRVNAVSPGPIATPILDKTLPAAAAEALRAQFRDTNPMKRLGDPDEIARAVLFLAFDATFTTGAELPVDGGASQL